MTLRRPIWARPRQRKKRAALYRTAFPDLHLTIEDVIAEGDTVMTAGPAGAPIKVTSMAFLQPEAHHHLRGDRRSRLERQDSGRLCQLGRSGPYAAARVVPQLANRAKAIAATSAR